ncbi:DUF2382 domain-containing protein [Actinoplanes sp. URMC 104]|uniref:DUF2382 domain-containing protein n=1 Tax=Actinoplanes sp. URMC 104 TaxID=3423409 RepID=UPI003F1B9DC2
MITQEQVSTLIGREVYDRDGDKIGKVGQVWADGAGMPAWASVNTGLFGLNESLVPLQNADVQADRLVVPFEKDLVKDAPNVDASHDEPLSEAEVDMLYRHYGLSWDDSYRAYQAGAGTARDSYTGTDGYDTSGPTTDDAMTRSEEHLVAGTEREQVGKARLRKYVVTEQQQVTVPVTREEVRLEREPITEANRGAAYSGTDITESEHEVTLHAERPVVDTETVPVERVRLGKETVTEQQTVAGEVRKEKIEADLPDEGRRTL